MRRLIKKPLSYLIGKTFRDCKDEVQEILATWIESGGLDGNGLKYHNKIRIENPDQMILDEYGFPNTILASTEGSGEVYKLVLCSDILKNLGKKVKKDESPKEAGERISGKELE